MLSQPLARVRLASKLRLWAGAASILVTACGQPAGDVNEALGSTRQALGEGLYASARVESQTFHINVDNPSTDVVPLPSIKIRTYFAQNDHPIDRWTSYYCSINPPYSDVGAKAVAAPFSLQPGADVAVTLTFAGNANKTLAPGQTIFDCLINTEGLSPLEGWSTIGLVAQTYTQTNRVQVLVDDQVVWGDQPGCNGDGECHAGAFCNSDHLCVARRSEGEACDAALCAGASCQVCKDGVTCADGFCCDVTCSGACEACAEALTGLPDGTCAPIPADEDPKNQCPADPDYPASCKADGLCDGKRQCRANAKTGTACGETACDAGEVSGFLCDGKGKCHQDVELCSPYACDGAACGAACETDDDCDAGVAFCVDGSCQATDDLGAPCDEARECGSGVCEDGVCCEHACTGQCEACGEAGQEGSCVAVSGEPRGDRALCHDGSAACAGACDGQEVTRCTYPSEDTVCASDCNDEREVVSVCDGTGECLAKKPRACGGYACGADTCLNSCSKAQDCASGYRCEAGECVPSTAKCSDDRTSSIPSDGDPVSCSPYLCDLTSGACADTCTSSDDCAESAICSADRACLPPPSARHDDDGGCAVSPASPHRAGGSSLLWLLLTACLMRSRKSVRSYLGGSGMRSSS